MEVLEIIGAIFSIIGVPIAIYQSLKAKSAAEAAKKAVNQVLEKKQLSVFVEIIEQGHKVENILNSQRGKKTPEFGRKLNTATNEIDVFISLLNEKKNNIADKEHRKIVEKSLESINIARRDFDDTNDELSQRIEDILQNTQAIISTIAEIKQNNEYS